MSDIEPLVMFAIYDHPRDFPTKFVARRWEVRTGPHVNGTLETERVTADADTLQADTLDELRTLVRLRLTGAVRLPRFEGDDPVIVEVWL